MGILYELVEGRNMVAFKNPYVIYSKSKKEKIEIRQDDINVGRFFVRYSKFEEYEDNDKEISMNCDQLKIFLLAFNWCEYENFIGMLENEKL